MSCINVVQSSRIFVKLKDIKKSMQPKLGVSDFAILIYPLKFRTQIKQNLTNLYSSRDQKFLHGNFLNSLTLPYFFFLDWRSELIGDNHCRLSVVHGIGIVVMATAYLPHELHECDIMTNQNKNVNKLFRIKIQTRLKRL